MSLRRVEDGALVFTTAMWTRKARNLSENLHVALLFHWPSLGRQVHMGGQAETAERALVEELFQQRDRPHQLQAMVSRQGEPIADLEELRRRLTIVRSEIGDAPIPCPDNWAAIRVHPEYIEYWTAATDALHDRIVFDRDGSGWRQTRLAP